MSFTVCTLCLMFLFTAIKWGGWGGRELRMNGQDENVIEISVRKYELKISLITSVRADWRIVLEGGSVGEDWTQVRQKWVQWPAVTNTIMILRLPWNEGIYWRAERLSSSEEGHFSIELYLLSQHLRRSSDTMQLVTIFTYRNVNWNFYWRSETHLVDLLCGRQLESILATFCLSRSVFTFPTEHK